MSYIVVDLDNTLVAPNYEQLGMIPSNWNWAKFGNSMRELEIYDGIYSSVLNLWEESNRLAKIIILTARPSFLRDLTKDSLKNSGIEYDSLITMGEKSTRRLVESQTLEERDAATVNFKATELLSLVEGDGVIKCYEDNPVNIKMMEMLGFDVIKCDRGEIIK